MLVYLNPHGALKAFGDGPGEIVIWRGGWHRGWPLLPNPGKPVRFELWQPLL